MPDGVGVALAVGLGRGGSLEVSPSMSEAGDRLDVTVEVGVPQATSRTPKLAIAAHHPVRPRIFRVYADPDGYSEATVQLAAELVLASLRASGAANNPKPSAGCQPI